MKEQCEIGAPCPCGSMETYGACCKPFHEGADIPDALSMLRARYSAHCLMLVDFVVRTAHPFYRSGLSEKAFREHVAQSMKNVLWLSLDVHKCGLLPTASDGEGRREFATFSVHYRTLGKDFGIADKDCCTEHTSLFERLDGKLYYTTDLDSLATRTPVRREARTGRNEPCPCGSGKKYKKCCIHKSGEDA